MINESMNRRKFLTGVAVASASGLLLPCLSGVALAAEPTLQETWDWLSAKVNEFARNEFTQPRLSVSCINKWRWGDYQWSPYKDLMIEWSQETTTNSGEKQPMFYRSIKVPLNLLLASQAVRAEKQVVPYGNELPLAVIPEHSKVIFQVREGRKLIRQLDKTEGAEPYFSNTYELCFADHDMAGRVAKAFSRLSILCEEKFKEAF